MILTKLTLHNIGLFRGTQVMDLSPSADDFKTIILLGGRNGVGKTTIFEAIRICLYGQFYEARSMSAAEYQAKLNDLIHRSRDGLHPTSGFVELEFSLTHAGQENKYVVRRLWERSPSGIVEKVTIRKNSEVVDDFDAAIWQDFLREIIPPGISKLFFFDGEKIQQLAEDRQDREYVSDSFKTLLGLELLARLQADLSIFISREAKKAKNATPGSELDGLREELNSLEKSLELNVQEHAEKSTLQSHLKGKIESLEAKIAEKGGDYAKSQGDTRQAKSKLDGEIDAREQQIRDLCLSPLPFALAPMLCQGLNESMEQESEQKKHDYYNQILSRKISGLGRLVNDNSVWANINLRDTDKKTLVVNLISTIEAGLRDSEKSCVSLIHDLSNNEQTRIVSWLSTAGGQSSKELNRLCNNLAELVEKRQNLEKKLKMVPLDDVLLPSLRELQELNQSLGQVEEQLRSIEEQRKGIEIRRKELQTRLTVIHDAIQDRKDLDERVKLANKVIGIIGEYSTMLKVKGIGKLEANFRDCFNRLSWKEDPVERVRIDPEDFSVTLYDSRNDCIHKDQLSAGEKQVFAISMLWALTRTSSRNLPFVIDTPLGRLDSEHRNNLVTDFFPKASHQTIILSTDTEIDMRYFSDLRPYVARSYRLHFDKKEKCTSIVEGYFWNMEVGLNDIQ